MGWGSRWVLRPANEGKLRDNYKEKIRKQSIEGKLAGSRTIARRTLSPDVAARAVRQGTEIEIGCRDAAAREPGDAR